MLKKTITYTDFNGNVRTEDFYFNLSKAELAEWELRENLSGGLQPLLQSIIQSNDGRKIIDAFRQIIANSYGIKSADGRSFIKSDEISSGFLGSEAYSVFFMELLENPDYAAEFINAIVPQNLEAEATRSSQTQQTDSRPQPQDRLPKAVKESYVSRPIHESGMETQSHTPWQTPPATPPAQPSSQQYGPFVD